MSVSFHRYPPCRTPEEYNQEQAWLEAWVNSGSAPANFVYPFDYIIKVADSVYTAYNSVGLPIYGSSSNAGSVDGTNCSAVLQACIDSGAAYISVGSGIFTLNSAVNLTQKTCIIGAGIFVTTFYVPNDTNGFVLKNAYCSLEKFEIKSTATNYTKSLIYMSDEYGNQVLFNTLRDLFIWRGMTANTGGTGLNLTATNTAYSITQNHFDNIVCFGRLTNGVLLQTTSNGWCNGNTFNSIKIYACVNGFNMQQDGASLSTNVFDKCLYQWHPTYSACALNIEGNRNRIVNCDFWDAPDATNGIVIGSGATGNKILNCYWNGLVSDSGTYTEFRDCTQQNMSLTVTYSERHGRVAVNSGDYVAHHLFATPEIILLSTPRVNVKPVIANVITGTADATQFQVRLYYCDDGLEVASDVDVDLTYYVAVNSMI